MTHNNPSSRVLAMLGAFALCAATHAAPADADVQLQTQPADTEVAAPQPAAGSFLEHASRAPRRTDSLALKDLTPERSVVLHGIRNTQQLEFTLRQDQAVTSAALQLAATPSPALLPRLSHLRVYLNDELAGVVPVVGVEPGETIRQLMPLDPLLLSRFNRIRLEFVGHYTEICEDLAHSSLWLDISPQTRVLVEQEALPLVNDLSFFPEPFFDAGDMKPQNLSFVFAQPPGAGLLTAAGVLASYFGSQADWKELDVSVYYQEPPKGRHAIIFATNDARPDFLAGYPKAEGPVIDLISDPDDPYVKRLLVLGRDDADLLRASTALGVGTPLLRGQSVTIDEVMELMPRKPYDAPNWTPTDRPVLFSELVDYPGQLGVSGLRPSAVSLNLNLPPDLFVWRNNGVPMQLRYRYTPLTKTDGSRLTMSLNEHYVESYLLEAGSGEGVLTKMRLPLVEGGAGASRALTIPGMKLGANNRMQFRFDFATVVGSAQRDECRTMLPVDVRAEVDGSSSIDFSGFGHYMEMPDLGAFAGSGFPFSRMADLSDTIVVAPVRPTREQVATVLETLAFIGAKVGYPAMMVRVADDWEAVKNEDADILVVGNLPQHLAQRPDANFILDGTKSLLRRPHDQAARLWRNSFDSEKDRASQDAALKVSLQSAAPIAAIVGMQSERYPQRSVVGLLASDEAASAMLRAALKDAGKRDAMRGSVVLVRESGVASATVGESYFVGHLPWWRKLWYQLSDKPVTLALVAVFVILLAAFLLWRVLSWVARRRLGRDA